MVLDVEIRVVAVDMDGTFLRPDMTYDRARFLRLRDRMRQLDVRFVVASGNQIQQLRSFFDPADEIAFVAENGLFLHDVADEMAFFAADLPADVSRVMIQTLERQRHPYILSGLSGAYLPAWVPEDAGALARIYFPKMETVDDPLAVADRVIRACFWAPEPLTVAAQIRDVLGGLMDVVVARPQDINLNVPGHNKATGLALLVARWGLDLTNVVAFGDNHNDLEMLSEVGLGVAVANARPELLAIADRVAPPNTADGVLAELEHLLAGLTPAKALP